MGRTKYRRVKINGKWEFVWDINGKWVRHKNKFILESKISEEDELRAEFNKLVRNHPKIKQRVKKIKDIKKKIYYAKVWILTEANDLTVLKNHEKRGFKKYHLDHIYPISESYKNGIPPEIVANIENLRFVTRRTNMKKGNKITKKGVDVMKKLLK
jgi:hypothetical protein